MQITVEQLLVKLEKPENADQIQHLANLKNIEHVENVKHIGGFGGAIARLVLRFTRKHMNAFAALAECETAADIAAFKQTEHYKKIKNSTVGTGFDLEQLKELEELKNLEELRDLDN